MQTLHLRRPSRKRPAKSHDPKLPIGKHFCKCAACSEYFLNAAAFDAHRIGEYRPVNNRGCAPTAQLPELGLRLEAGIWRFPRRVFLDARRRHLEAAA